MAELWRRRSGAVDREHPYAAPGNGRRYRSHRAVSIQRSCKLDLRSNRRCRWREILVQLAKLQAMTFRMRSEGAACHSPSETPRSFGSWNCGYRLHSEKVHALPKISILAA